MKELALLLVISGIVLVIIGLIVWLFAASGLHVERLPGDIHLSGKNWSIYFPIITCIILSILLTIILNIFLRR